MKVALIILLVLLGFAGLVALIAKLLAYAEEEVDEDQWPGAPENGWES